MCDRGIEIERERGGGGEREEREEEEIGERGQLLHCQMFVDDTILLTNNEDDIQTQFHRFNKFASICGDQSMILSADNIKNDGQWLIETGMEEAPTKLFKYLDLWCTL